MAAKGEYRQEESGASICACVNVRRASRAMTRIYDQALEPSRLKVTQYSVLATVLHKGPINVSNLARSLKLERTTLVRNLKSLEAAGYLEERAASDPRERLLAISPAGREAVETALPHWQSVQRKIRQHLGKEHLDQLAALVVALEKLSADLEAE